MLRTRERSLLLETLRPPVGYALDRAIGTSYTLDLPALLAAPLAFTFFNYQDEAGEPTRDPVALLEALRRHAERLTIFCQAGAIAVPRPQLTLLSHLESSVVQVRAPREGGIFHPKTWLLRYVADDRPVRYRFLCLSRNLTFDRAWDTCLLLEGELAEGGEEIAGNAPLADFVAALPGLATRPVPESVGETVSRLAAEVRRVPFEPPPPFQEVAFHPLGLAGRSAWPFPRGVRALVISPYLSDRTVRRLGQEQKLSVLISRPEELEALSEAVLPGDGTFVLSPAARLDAQEASEGEDGPEAPEESQTSEPELTGLHAKVFLVETAYRAHLFVGSANATSAGFGWNVELLVELVGGRWRCGVDELLGKEEDQAQDSLRSLLQRYERPEHPVPPDEVQQRLDRAAEALAREIGAATLSAHVREHDADALYDLELRGRLPALPAEATVSVWPATLSSGLGQEPGGDGALLARFEAVTFEALTAFWAFRVELRKEGRSAERRFVVSVSLEGAPADRRERLLQSLLKDKHQVLRLLLLLLSDEALDVAQLAEEGDGQGGIGWRRLAGWEEPTLLEALLESLIRDPRRLDQAARLIEDLKRTPEGRDLLPPELDEIWAPVWKVRGAAGA